MKRVKVTEEELKTDELKKLILQILRKKFLASTYPVFIKLSIAEIQKMLTEQPSCSEIKVGSKWLEVSKTEISQTLVELSETLEEFTISFTSISVMKKDVKKKEVK